MKQSKQLIMFLMILGLNLKQIHGTPGSSDGCHRSDVCCIVQSPMQLPVQMVVLQNNVRQAPRIQRLSNEHGPQFNFAELGFQDEDFVCFMDCCDRGKKTQRLVALDAYKQLVGHTRSDIVPILGCVGCRRHFLDDCFYKGIPTVIIGCACMVGSICLGR